MAVTSDIADCDVRPRIAIFVPSLLGGGAEQVMAQLATGFAERGYPVDLLVTTSEGPCRALVSPRVRILDFKRGGVFRALPDLIGYLRREPPAALLSAMSHTNVTALLADAIVRPATRMVVSERTSYSARIENFDGVRERVVRLLMRVMYPRADAIVVVAHAMIDELCERLHFDRSRIVAIGNPVVDGVMLERSHEFPEKGWPAPEGVRAVLAVGRLSHEKGFEMLLHAFSLLSKRVPAHLIILGAGEDLLKLETLAQELRIESSVSFLGFVQNPFAYMRRADVFVLSSKFEGLPGVLIQAMACGAPVVSTDCRTGPAEILEGGIWGRLVPVDDAQAMAAAIEDTLSEAEHPPVAQRALDYTLDHALDKYLGILLPDR